MDKLLLQIIVCVKNHFSQKILSYFRKKKKRRRNYSCGLFLSPNFQSYFVTFLKHPILVFGVEFGFWKLFLKLTLKNETWLAKIWIQKSKVNTNGSLETNTESQPDFCQLYRLVVTENYWPNLRLFTVDAHLLSIMVNISWTVGNSLLVYISVIWWFFFRLTDFAASVTYNMKMSTMFFLI